MDKQLFRQTMNRAELVIIDLGGVLVDIDIPATARAFAALGVDNLQHYITQSHAGDGIFGNFERGLVSPAEFIAEVRRLSHLSPTDEQITAAWNSMLGSFGIDKVRIIEALRQTKRVVLLSNTNQIHYEAFAHAVPGYATVEDLFDDAYYSHTLHLSKPNPEIYQTVIRQQRIDPSRAVFFDDSELNISAACALGINGFRITPEMDLSAYMKLIDIP